MASRRSSRSHPAAFGGDRHPSARTQTRCSRNCCTSPSPTSQGCTKTKLCTVRSRSRHLKFQRFIPSPAAQSLVRLPYMLLLGGAFESCCQDNQRFHNGPPRNEERKEFSVG